MNQQLLMPLRLLAGASPCAGGMPGACETPIFNVTDEVFIAIMSCIMLVAFIVLTNGYLAGRLSKRLENHKISSIFIMLLATVLLPKVISLLIAGMSLLVGVFGVTAVGLWHKYLFVIVGNGSIDYSYSVLFLLSIVVALVLVGIILFTAQQYPRVARGVIRGAAVAFVITVLCLVAFVEIPSRETVLDETQRAAEKCRLLENSLVHNNVSCEY